MNYLNRIFYRILIIAPGFTCAWAQLSDGDRWLLAELSPYADQDIILFSSYRDIGKPLTPPDIPYELGRSADAQVDQLIFHKSTLILAVDGSGILHELHFMGKDFLFKRLDQTIFSGYNFNAYVFSLRDTIFSVGGYGFWNFNGQLRYFNTVTSVWNILPVNQKIPVVVQNTWLDRGKGHLYFIESFLMPKDESLMPTQEFLDGKDSKKEILWQLNLASRKWIRAGFLKDNVSNSRNMLANSKAGDLPMGELFIGTNKNLPLGLLINYATNKTYEFRSGEKTNLIHSLLKPELSLESTPNRVITFYTKVDSSFHILRSDSVHEQIKLSLQDFKELEQPVYEPAPEESAVDSYAWLMGIFAVSGTLFFIGGVVVLKKAKEVRKSDVVNHSSPSTFTASELQIIERFHASPNHLATTDDLDTWLGNSNKSLDLRTKARSLFIRGINQKYSLVTGDPHGLIQAERMDADRRMVRYRFDREKFNKLMAGSGRASE